MNDADVAQASIAMAALMVAFGLFVYLVASGVARLSASEKSGLTEVARKRLSELQKERMTKLLGCLFKWTNAPTANEAAISSQALVETVAHYDILIENVYKGRE